MKVHFKGVSDAIWISRRKKPDDPDYDACSWFADFNGNIRHDQFEYAVVMPREDYQDWAMQCWYDPPDWNYGVAPLHPIVGGEREFPEGNHTSHVLVLFEDLDDATVFRLTWGQ